MANITTEKEEEIIKTFSKELKSIINKNAQPQDEILIVGLGNLYATPDSLGSKVVQNIEITRHIKIYLPKNRKTGNNLPFGFGSMIKFCASSTLLSYYS